MGLFTRRVPDAPRPGSRHTGVIRPGGSPLVSPSPPRGGGIAQAPLPYSAVRSMTASARRISLDDQAAVEMLARSRSGGEWQSEAWEYYDAIGEIKYAFMLVANVMSRVRLYAARVDDPSEAPTPIDVNTDSDVERAVLAAVSRLSSSVGGQAALMRDAALNLSVTGECNLVQTVAPPIGGTQESWDIRSVDELNVMGNKVTVQLSRDARQSDLQVLPKNAFVARVWRQHPRWSNEADSSMRGLLDLCAELLLLNRTFRATARSRLNSGMLYLPDGLSVASGGDAIDEAALLGDDSVDPGMLAGATGSSTADEDEFEEALIEAMTTPIMNEDSAAAVVPLIIRGPAELADKIKQFNFERSFDPALASRSDRVLERIMQGLDVPKDLVTGLAAVKYANAMVIDESLYKTNIEPLALLISDAFTFVYLRPALKAFGVSDAEARRYVIWYDPSEVTTRPNRADDADQGFDRYTVSASAWRRSHGFTDADAPDAEEIATRMIVERGSVTPELTEAALQAIAPGLMADVREAGQAASDSPLPPEITDALGMPAPGMQPSEPIGEPLPLPTAPPASSPSAPSDVVTPQELLR